MPAGTRERPSLGLELRLGDGLAGGSAAAYQQPPVQFGAVVDAEHRHVANDFVAQQADGMGHAGIGELTALTWLPRLVALARQTHPGLALQPCVDIGSVLEERTDRGQLDFAVIAGRSSRSTIASHPLTEARFVWAASAAVAGRTRRLTSALLERTPLVTLPAGAGTTRILDDWLLAQGVTAEQRLVCNHWGAIAGLLVEGMGVGFLPEGWARALSRRGQLRILESHPALAPLPYAYQWRRDDTRPLITHMRELALRCADFSHAGRLF